MALMHTLTDPFTTLDTTTKWAFSYGTPTLTSGRVHLSCVNTYEGLYSGTTYDLTDSSLTVEMVSIPTGGGNSRHTSIVCEINSTNRLEMGYIGDQLYFRQIASGTTTTWESATYNSSTHRWWRIAHVTGVGVTAYYSSNGTSWTAFGVAHTTSLTLTSMYAHIFCGYYGTETSPPDAQIDNVNNPPTAANAGHASATATVTPRSFARLPSAIAVAATSNSIIPSRNAAAGTATISVTGNAATSKVGGQANSQPLIGMYGGYGSFGGTAGATANETLLGRQMMVATDYLPHDSWTRFNTTTMRDDQLDPWKTWRDARTGTKFVYGIPLLTDDNVGDFAGVVAGDYDSYFTIAGNALVAAGHPDAIIMLGWEPNNANIGSWQATSNPSGYASAFQHVVTLLRGISSNQFTFLLENAIGYSGSIDDFNDHYPGNSYVDYIGMNIYDVWTGNPSATPAQRWTQITTSAGGLDDHVAFVQSKGKVNVCAEWGLYAANGSPDYDGGGDSPYFIQQMANYFRTSKVYFHTYFDYDWGGGSLEDYPNGQAEYRALFQAPDMGRATAYNAVAVKTLIAQHVSGTATAYGATVPGNRTASPTPVGVAPSVVNQPTAGISINPRRIGF